MNKWITEGHKGSHTEAQMENLIRRDHLVNITIDGRVILKWVLQGDPVNSYHPLLAPVCSMAVMDPHSLAEILGVDMPLFPCNTQFYFYFLHHYFVSFIKGNTCKISTVAQSIAPLPMVLTIQVQFPC
jgi:hypothetical protein